MSPLSGYTPLLQFWHFNKGIIIIIIIKSLLSILSMLISLNNCKTCVPTVGNLSHFHPIYLKILHKAFQNGPATAFSLQYSACLYIYFCMFSTAQFSIRVILVGELPIRSGAKRKIGRRIKLSTAWGRQKGEGAYRICFDATHPWYQILISWCDWSDSWLLTRELWIPMKNTHMCGNVIEADPFNP